MVLDIGKDQFVVSVTYRVAREGGWVIEYCATSAAISLGLTCYHDSRAGLSLAAALAAEGTPSEHAFAKLAICARRHAIGSHMSPDKAASWLISAARDWLRVNWARVLIIA